MGKMPKIPCYAKTHPRIGRPETAAEAAAVFGQMVRQNGDGEWECRRKTSLFPELVAPIGTGRRILGVAGCAGSLARTRLRANSQLSGKIQGN